MKLKIRDGQLTLGSVFKLVAISWCCFGIIFCVFFLLIALVGVASGSMSVNGVMVHGRGAVLAAMLPMILLVPTILAFQAVLFGGFVVAGAALYRTRRPLSVIVETTTTGQP